MPQLHVVPPRPERTHVHPIVHPTGLYNGRGSSLAVGVLGAAAHHGDDAGLLGPHADVGDDDVECYADQDDGDDGEEPEDDASQARVRRDVAEADRGDDHEHRPEAVLELVQLSFARVRRVVALEDEESVGAPYHQNKKHDKHRRQVLCQRVLHDHPRVILRPVEPRGAVPELRPQDGPGGDEAREKQQASEHERGEDTVRGIHRGVLVGAVADRHLPRHEGDGLREQHGAVGKEPPEKAALCKALQESLVIL
mmetsp:Transcript_2400/g.4829  ORF Transcript_2400/g.4829 Transcript_2400/m.4829 type:complete len:253 (-) Transcript_2400:362-1120(-)